MPRYRVSGSYVLIVEQEVDTTDEFEANDEDEAMQMFHDRYWFEDEVQIESVQQIGS